MNKEFWQEVERLIRPVISPQIEYRLHYNEQGEVVMCSMVDHPDSKHYIVVTKLEYERYFDYCVLDGKLIKIDKDSGYRVQLKASTQGFTVVKGHAGLVLDATESHKEIEHYAYRNS
jgi:hypothetical protein